MTDMTNDKTSKTTKISFLYSWFMIIVGFSLIGPFAIPLLIGRAKRDRHATLTIGKLLAAFGFIFGTLLALPLLAGFYPKPEMYETVEIYRSNCLAYFLVIFIDIILMGLFVFGVRLMKWAGKVKKYINLIVNQHVFSITAIAASLNISEAKVIADVKEMTRCRFLPEAEIDEARLAIRVPLLEAQIRFQQEVEQMHRQAEAAQKGSGESATSIQHATETIPAAQSNYAEANRPKMSVCNCCGARNMVFPNRSAVCEFCGSFI